MTTQPYSKKEILSAIETVFDEISNVIVATPEGIFNQKPGVKWSIAEQMVHLIQSTFPVASALKLPKEKLAMFGQPERASRPYKQLRSEYKTVLKAGAKAPSQYVPIVKEGTTKAGLLENWNVIKGKFLSRVADWSEADLDKYVLLHPIMGKFTIREMLFFTILHNYHHLESIEELEKNFI